MNATTWVIMTDQPFFSVLNKFFLKLIRIENFQNISKSIATLLLHNGSSWVAKKLFKNVFVSFNILLILKFD